ncbi:hypothetical protein D3C84_657520 [compost metagenome]
MVQVTGRQFRQLLAEFDGLDVGHVAERIGVGQLADLVGDGLGHFLTAQADVGAPHAAHGVQVAIAGGVVDVGATACGNVQRAVFPVVVEDVVAVHVVRLVGGHEALIVELGEEVGVWGLHGRVLGCWAVQFTCRS